MVASFSLSHVADLAAAFGEVRRVLRPGGALASATFNLAAPADPVKSTIDAVAERFGFERPAWYEAMKAHEGRVGRADLLARHAAAAGLTALRVEEVQVESGLQTAEDLARYRLGTSQFAPFVAGLGPERRRALFQDVCQTLGPTPQPWRPAVLILSSRAAA